MIWVSALKNGAVLVAWIAYMDQPVVSIDSEHER
jgi:hypothetical protein